MKEFQSTALYVRVRILSMFEISVTCSLMDYYNLRLTSRSKVLIIYLRINFEKQPILKGSQTQVLLLHLRDQKPGESLL